MNNSFDLRASSSWGEQSKKYKCHFAVMTATLGAIMFNNFYPAWFGDRGLYFECINVTLAKCHPTDARSVAVQVTQMTNSVSMGILLIGYLLEVARLCIPNSARIARHASIPNQLIVAGGVFGIVSFIISIWTIRRKEELATMAVGWAGGMTLWFCILMSSVSSRVLYHADHALTFCYNPMRFIVLGFYLFSQTPVFVAIWIRAQCRRCCGCKQQVLFNLDEGPAGVVSQSRLQSFSHLIEGSSSSWFTGSASQRGRGARRLQGTTSPMLAPIQEECEEQEVVTTEFGIDTVQSETAASEQVDFDREAALAIDVGSSDDSIKGIEHQVKPGSPSRKRQEDDHEEASLDRE